MRELAALRDRLNVTCEELAGSLDVTPIGVVRLEESVDPRLSSLHRYASALSVVSGCAVSVDVVVRVDGNGGPSAGGATPTSPGDAGQADGGDRAVRLRAWGDALLEDQMVREGFVSIGGDEVGDMSEWPGRDTLAQTLAAALPDRDPQAIQLFCTYWDRFVRFLRVGDLVVVPSSKARTVAVGEITGGYEHHPVDSDPRTRHRRPVHWLASAVNRDDLPADIRRAVNAPGTIGAIKAPDAASRLRALAPR
jgi:hypothetical protein